jgi:hypothetical protein
MSTMRESLTTRSPCWRGSSVPCTSSGRIEGDHLGAILSAGTPPTSSLTTPRGRNSTPPTSMTTTTGMTTTRVTRRRRTATGTIIIRRSSKRSCLESVLPRATLTSPVMTPLAQRRMRRSSTSKATSPAFASWANLQEASPTPTLI